MNAQFSHMDRINPLFTATATAIGGRNGHTQTSDGVVKADLSVPKEMGGPGKPGAATPEHLFAAGYAACFGGALDFVAKQKKRNAAKATITSQGHDHQRRVDGPARRRRFRPRCEDARRGQEHCAGGACRVRPGSASPGSR